MGYYRIYLKRSVTLGALIGLTTASSLALFLGLGISGIAGALILKIAEIAGVSANSVFVLPPNQVVERVVETGTPQLIGLQIALVLYFILRLVVDWIRTRGGTADAPGVTFSNSLKESLRLTVVNMVKIGIPLSILVFCGTTYAGFTFYKMGDIGSESLLIVIIQSLTLTPMLSCSCRSEQKHYVTKTLALGIGRKRAETNQSSAWADFSGETAEERTDTTNYD